MGELSTLDEGLIGQLRRDKVLRDFDPSRFDPGRMAIVTCADGQRILEQLTQHWRFIQRHEPKRPLESCILQTVALNGGALLLAKDSPLLRPGLLEDKMILEHLREGIKLKGLDQNGERPTVALYTHFPCGAAGLHNLNTTEQVRLVAEAKDRLKLIQPNWRVICMVHVHYPAQGRLLARDRTYHFSRAGLRLWLKDSYNADLVRETHALFGPSPLTIATA